MLCPGRLVGSQTDLHFFKAIPNINLWEWVYLNNRRYDVLLARLRSGCVDLNNYMFTIKKRENPFSDYCPNDRETVEPPEILEKCK